MKRINEPVKDRKYLWITWLTLAIGVVLFLFRNTHEGLWFDETCTYGVVNRSIGEVWQLIAGDFHPPLYFVLVNIFAKIFGDSVFVMRAFSALGALSLAALGIGPVRRIFGRRTGMFFTILVVTTPIIIVYAQEMRMYTWAAFWTTAAVCYAFLSFNENKPQDWVLYGICCLASIYTHFYGMLAMIAVNLLLFIWAFIKARKHLKRLLLVNSAILLFFLPWIVNILGQATRVMKYYWIQPLTPGTLWQIVSYPYSLKFNVHLLTPALFIVSAALVLSGIIISRKASDRERLMVRLALGTLILTLTLAVLISYITRPILVPRYIVSLVGLLMIPIAYCVANIKFKWLAFAGMITLIVLSSPIIFDIYRLNNNGPTAEQYGVFKTELRPDDVLVCMDETTMGVFSYYYADYEVIFIRDDNLQLVENHRVFIPKVTVSASLNQVFREYYGKRIWIFRTYYPNFGQKGILTKADQVKYKKGKLRVLQSPSGYTGIKIYQTW